MTLGLGSYVLAVAFADCILMSHVSVYWMEQSLYNLENQRVLCGGLNRLPCAPMLKSLIKLALACKL